MRRRSLLVILCAGLIGWLTTALPASSARDVPVNELRRFWFGGWRTGFARLSEVLRCGGASLAFVLIVTVLFVSSSPVFAAESKRVMLLFSFGRDFKPWSEYATAIRGELNQQSPWPLDITEHSVVSVRSSDDDPEKPFVEYLRALYAKHPPDVIISLGAPAAAFVQQYRRELFPSSPMVLTAIEQRRVRYSTLTQNDAVVPVHIDYRAVIENILKVLPNTKRISIVVGTSPIEKFWRAEIAKELEPLKSRVGFRWYDEMSFEQILKDAASLPPGSAIFWELMLVDAAGVVHEGDDALSRLYDVSSAPIFSYDDSFFGRDIVGGPLLSVAAGSRQAAAVAIRILGGERAGDIRAAPIEFAKPKFDWREMQRWEISESRLPPGSQILFRDPSAWEKYRAEISTIIAVILVQAALIAWLLYEHGRRRRSEFEAHELSGQLISAHEDERARIARGLHDDISQRLAALAIDAGRCERNLKGVGHDALRSMRERLARLGEDVHALSYRLHPRILKDLGLIEALKSECGSFTHCPVELEIRVSDTHESLPPDISLCLFRIAQEGMRNIVRHAKASRAEILLEQLDRGLQLTVRDDGVGFDLNRGRTGVSLGLASMRQRIHPLGGKITVKTSPGHGTTIVAWVPLKRSAYAASYSVNSELPATHTVVQQGLHQSLAGDPTQLNA